MPQGERWLYAWGLGYVAVGGASLLVPVYALTLGADAFAVGLLAATAAFAGVPGALVCGPLAERTGRSRAFVVGPLLAVGGTLLAMAFSSSVRWLLVLNTGLWFAVAAAAPVCNLSMVAGRPIDTWDDQLAQLNRVQGYGWVLGLAVGIVWLGAGAMAPTTAQRSLLVLLAGAAVVGAAAVQAWFAVPAARRRTAERLEERFARGGRRDLGAGRFLRLNPLGPGRLYWLTRHLDPAAVRAALSGPLGTFLVATALFATGSAIFWGPMPAYLDSRGLSTAAIFAVFLAGNLGSAVTYGRVAALEPVVGADRLQIGAIGVRALLFPGTVLLGGGIVLVLGGFFVLVGVSWALVAVTAPLLTARLARPDRRGGALAVYTAVMSAGTGVGSVLGGAVASASTYLVAYSAAGAIVLIAAVLAWRGLAGASSRPVSHEATVTQE